MSILGNMLKKAVKEAVSDKVKEKVQDTVSSVAEKVEDRLEEHGIDVAALKERAEEAAASEKTESASEAAEQEYVYQTVKLVKEHKEPFNKDLTAKGCGITDRGSAEYFAELINVNLPDVQLEKNVSPAEYAAELPDRNVNADLLLFRDGKPALAIFLVGKNSYKRVAVINSMNAFENAGIPALRFMKEFSNEADYTIGRIRAVML